MSETPNTPQTPSDEKADPNIPHDKRIMQTGTPGDGKGRVDVIGPTNTDTDDEPSAQSGNTPDQSTADLSE